MSSSKSPATVSRRKRCFRMPDPLSWSPKIDPALIQSTLDSNPDADLDELMLADDTRKEDYMKGYEPLSSLPQEMFPLPGSARMVPKFYYGLIIAPKQYLDYHERRWPSQHAGRAKDLVTWQDIQRRVMQMLELKYKRKLVLCNPMYKKMTGMIAVYSNYTIRDYYLDGYAERDLLLDLANMLKLPRDMSPVWCRAWESDNVQAWGNQLKAQERRRKQFFKKKRALEKNAKTEESRATHANKSSKAVQTEESLPVAGVLHHDTTTSSSKGTPTDQPSEECPSTWDELDRSTTSTPQHPQLDHHACASQTSFQDLPQDL